MIAGAVGVGLAAGVAVAFGRSGKATLHTEFSGARFSEPTLVCPDGSVDHLLDVAILVDVNNGDTKLVPISTVSCTLILMTSPTSDFSTTRGTSVSPTAVPAGQQTTLRASTKLLCANPVGDAARSDQWGARVILTTPVGVFTLNTADRLRVDFP